MAEPLPEIPLKIEPEMVDPFAIHLAGLLNQFGPVFLNIEPLKLSAILGFRRYQAGAAATVERGDLIDCIPPHGLNQPVRSQPTLRLFAQPAGK